MAKKAYAERSRYGSSRDILESHLLPDEVIVAFRELLQPIIKDVDEVYLVRRRVNYIPEEPHYVIIVSTGILWYHIRLHSPIQQAGKYLSEKLRGFFEIGTYTVTVDFPIYIKKAKAVSGALVYKKANVSR